MPHQGGRDRLPMSDFKVMSLDCFALTVMLEALLRKSCVALHFEFGKAFMIALRCKGKVLEEVCSIKSFKRGPCQNLERLDGFVWP